MDPNQIIGAGALGYLNIKNSKNTNIIKATNYLCSCDDGSYLSRKDESLELNKCCLKINSFGRSLCHCIFE